ncbi:MAG: quinolinate synthase NadA [Calditrichaeota bacterium]|nr:MAG: quinolinate synthase NadA [Calditrichota bacterium]
MDTQDLTVANITGEDASVETIQRIKDAKEKLGDKLIILGHYYQRDEVFQFADIFGDSFELSRKAALVKNAKYIIFCGVHFMAESADVLTSDEQIVILPDLKAGCSMADMANIEQVEDAWEEIASATDDTVIPITYMNSTAAIKAFCGRNGGTVCTSSNAEKIFNWAFEKGKKLFFFPDQHLGRNTAYKMGIPLEKMIVWDPFEDFGGNTEKAIQDAQILLWKGHCSVHQHFKSQYADMFRKMYPEIKILAHPECNFETIQNADFVGSTSYIINQVNNSPAGSKWAVGTEINLVNRLAHENPDKFVTSLSPYSCHCSTMYRISADGLASTLENLLEGKVENQIKVPDDIAKDARLALSRMLDISAK